jgi:hypothetical protein
MHKRDTWRTWCHTRGYSISVQWLDAMSPDQAESRALLSTHFSVFSQANSIESKIQRVVRDVSDSNDSLHRPYQQVTITTERGLGHIIHTAHWDNLTNLVPSLYLIPDTRPPWGSECISIDPPVFFFLILLLI